MCTRVIVCVCWARREYMALHFRADCALPSGGARCQATPWKASTHYLSFPAANKSAAKSDYDQERFMGMIQKKIQSWGDFEAKPPKAVRLERGKRESCLHITFLLSSKQLCRHSQGICLNPAQEEGTMIITENNLQENKRQVAEKCWVQTSSKAQLQFERLQCCVTKEETPTWMHIWLKMTSTEFLLVKVQINNPK